MELVLAEPDIQEPTAIWFDGDGRLVVLEDRGYMQDADGNGELDPVGRVSIHTDTDNDGKYDKHSVFVDKLSFPRFAMPYGPNALLIKESNAQELWKYTDTDGDGVADKRELFASGFGRLANVEHQEGFLTSGLDNWLYSTENNFRARQTAAGVVKETTGNGGAQWGLAQDNYGKMWFQGGASGLPSYWEFPILYGNFGGARGAGPDLGGRPLMDPDLGITWGAPVRIADMQGGLSVTRMPDGSLRSATAGAGGDIVRGHRMPADLQGDYVYGEVVGRIVRRVSPETTQGITRIRNYYDASEFIKSTDPLFRPVDQATAPDGTLYIVDMYRGIIQEACCSGPGSYLRKRIEQYGLDKVVRHGRIWRLVYDGVARDRSDGLDRDKTMPRMNEETAAQLVAHLGHPNGWWRDTAQQLLVLKQDQAVVPTLQRLVTSSTNALERIHALWTLEGLGALDAAMVRRQMADPDPKIRIQAIRASETLFKAGDKSFADDYKKLITDPDVDVVIQAMLTMNRWNVAEAAATLKSVAGSNSAQGVQLVAHTILNPPATTTGMAASYAGGFTSDERAMIERGRQIYGELCFACHGADGYGAPRPGMSGTIAPPLAGSPRVSGHRDYIVNAILHGLTGPLDGVSYQEVMVPNTAQPDDWVSAVASFVRTSFSNTGGVVTPADVRRVRVATTSRKSSWTVPELTASLPIALPADRSTWKLTASHNSGSAAMALSLTGWTSQTSQTAGMWFQVQLPTVTTVTELQFTSSGCDPGVPGVPGSPDDPRGGPCAAENASPEPRPAVVGGRRPAGPPPDPGFPREYKLEGSSDGTTWTVLASGQGTGTTTTMTFAPTRVKLLRLTQTSSAPNLPPLSISNLHIYAAPHP
jgi:mono/diheme cytochrome c family protein/glucose/arabinose dehydrogenase